MLIDSGQVVKFGYIGDAPLSTLSSTFDANWYADIATNGYSTSPDTSLEQNYHFFPLLPLLMRLFGEITGLGLIGGGYSLAGVFLSHIFFLAALVLLYKLTITIFDDAAMATRTVWLISTLPWAFAFSMTYTESLFLMLSLGAILIAYNAREHPRLHHVLVASMLAMLATLTRPQGLLVLLPVSWLLAVAPRGLSLVSRFANTALAGAPALLAALAFPIFIGFRTGNMAAVMEVNRNWGGQGWLADLPRVLVLPPANHLWLIDVFSTAGLIVWGLASVLLVARFLSTRRDMLDSTTTGLHFRDVGSWAFVLYALGYFVFTMIILPLNSSWGRYMIVVFPAIWVFATGLHDRQRFRRVNMILLALQVISFAATLFMQVTP